MVCQGVLDLFKVLVHVMNLELVEIRDRCVLSTSFSVFAGTHSQSQGEGTTGGFMVSGSILIELIR